MKKITSFTHHVTEEGHRLSYTYSEIDDNGDVKKSNERMTCIITPDRVKVLEAIEEINTFLFNRF
nr:MAG TPA: hypothetical protein [Bacteriophage sp.]